MIENAQEQLQNKIGNQTTRNSRIEMQDPSQSHESTLDEALSKADSYRVLDRRRIVDRRKQSRRILDKERLKATRPSKDGWDKVAAMAPIISGTLIFVMGGWFTYTFNQQQLRLQEVQTIEKFIPHLMGNEQSKKAAILAISAMTNPELAGKFASIFASSGTVSALQKIASTGTEQEKTAANKALSDALEALAAQQSKLSDVETSYKQAIRGADANADQDDLSYKMNKLAQLYTIKGQYSLAEPLFRKSLQLREKLYGADSPSVAEVLKGMAEMYQTEGQTAQAESCLKQAREIESKAQSGSGSAPRPQATPAETTTAPVPNEVQPAKEPDKETHQIIPAPGDTKTHYEQPHGDGKAHTAPVPQASEAGHSLSESSTSGDLAHPVAERESEAE